MDVYVLNLSENCDMDTVTRLLPFLDKEKQGKVMRFYRWEDTLRSLFAELMIRNIIIEKTGARNKKISFFTNDYGKPALKNIDMFHFNLSHSGEWVVCAVDDQSVGIDVEEISPIDLSISEHYFSKDEHSDLISKPDSMDYFFTLWTLKESYIKIVGKGLSMPLNSFSIRFKEENEIRIDAKGKMLKDIFFTQYEIDERYKMAVCAHKKEFPGTIKEVKIKELVDSFLYK